MKLDWADIVERKTRIPTIYYYTHFPVGSFQTKMFIVLIKNQGIEYEIVEHGIEYIVTAKVSEVKCTTPPYSKFDSFKITLTNIKRILIQND